MRLDDLQRALDRLPTKAAKAVYLALETHDRRGREQVWPGVYTLARMTGLSRETVRAQYAVIEAAGVGLLSADGERGGDFKIQGRDSWGVVRRLRAQAAKDGEAKAEETRATRARRDSDRGLAAKRHQRGQTGEAAS
jgi:hypothetical protein